MIEEEKLRSELGYDGPADYRTSRIGQAALFVTIVDSIFSPELYLSDGKVFQYNGKKMKLWKALLCLPHTMLSCHRTWIQLGLLFLLAGLTALITYSTGSFQSVADYGTVTWRTRFLLSIVIASYVSLVIMRWDRLRNTYIHGLWSGLENLNLLVYRIRCKGGRDLEGTSTALEGVVGGERGTPDSEFLKLQCSQLVRYSRLCLRLLFLASQGNSDIDQLMIAEEPSTVSTASLPAAGGVQNVKGDDLLESGGDERAKASSSRALRKSLLNMSRQPILLGQERDWLSEARPGTRPLMVVAWIHSNLDALLDILERQEGASQRLRGHHRRLTQAACTAYRCEILQNVMQIRGSIGGTLGQLGCPLPYSYVHLVRWIVEIFLCAMAVETGVKIATSFHFHIGANSGFTPPDGQWPYNPHVWWWNRFFQNIIQNLLFALFSAGLMNLLDKLSNPMQIDDSSFPERVYEVLLVNNLAALRAGISHPPGTDAR